MGSGLTVLVVLNGDIDSAFLAQQVAAADYVVAADGGASAVTALGAHCDVIVGDGDSLGEAGFAQARAANPDVEIRRFPTAKNATDAELALRTALEADPERIVVVGAFGGARLDHELATVMLLASPRWRDREVVLADGCRDVRLVTDRAEIRGRVGDLVTLLAVGGSAENIQSSGLAYELDGRSLEVGTSLGVSNELTGSTARLAVGSGMLLLVHEHGSGGN
ncbi:MAG: thiamine diphosphokinase [Chloroflexi bacterium]|nr:thiamine diphosphokinase [Chloroflexota bacterium]